MERKYNTERAKYAETIVLEVSGACKIDKEKIDGLLLVLSENGDGIDRENLRKMGHELGNMFDSVVDKLYDRGIICGPDRNSLFLENQAYHYLISLGKDIELIEPPPICLARGSFFTFSKRIKKDYRRIRRN